MEVWSLLKFQFQFQFQFIRSRACFGVRGRVTDPCVPPSIMKQLDT